MDKTQVYNMLLHLDFYTSAYPSINFYFFLKNTGGGIPPPCF